MGPCGYPRVKDPWNNLKLFHILPHMDIINYSICVLHFGIINNQIARVYLRYTKIPNISMRDLHDPELYTIEIINIKQSTTKPTTYKQYQPYVSMIWIGHHQSTNQPYINPQKYNRKILSSIAAIGSRCSRVGDPGDWKNPYNQHLQKCNLHLARYLQNLEGPEKCNITFLR